MPFAAQPQAEPVTGRDKRRIVIVIAALVVVLAGVGIWAVLQPGSYGASKNGCITVTLPSTTGGALLHQCGADARATCRRAFAGSGKVAALTRPQCRLAGLGPKSQRR
ncbi:MAG TPA: hypothetical protein VGM14_06210 [Streptosporangiaceae bacterium]|jgi:hypothetical protein